MKRNKQPVLGQRFSRRVILRLARRVRLRGSRLRPAAPLSLGATVAQGGLALVHRRSQRFLLLEAIEIQLQRSPLGRLLSAADHAALELGCWRAKCAAEMSSALADGAVVNGDLLALMIQEPRFWPQAHVMARGISDTEPSALGQWALVRALVVRGDSAGARAVAVAMDARLLGRRQRGVLAECLAMDAQRRGDDPAALAAFRSAINFGAGARSCFAASLLALEMGDSLALEQCSQQLEGMGCCPPERRSALLELAEIRALIGRPLSMELRFQLERLCILSQRPQLDGRGLVL